jgi:hypothetical protein
MVQPKGPRYVEKRYFDICYVQIHNIN